jgi:hypothetical protein
MATGTERPARRSLARRLSNSPFVQAAVVLLLLAVAFSGRLSDRAMTVCVTVAFFTLAFGILSHASRSPFGIAVLVTLVALGGFALWRFNRYLQRRDGLTGQQQAEFTGILKTIWAPPDYVKIACPETDEPTCVYASSFIPMFQRAGWTVEGPAIQRLKLGRPTSEVVIVQYGPEEKDLQDPDRKHWVTLSAWTQVLKTAFQMIGLTPKIWSDPQLGPQAIRVYFGELPQQH